MLRKLSHLALCLLFALLAPQSRGQFHATIFYGSGTRVDARDFQTQQLIWSRDLGSSIQAIVVVPDRGYTVALVQTPGGTIALSAETGAQRWSAPGLNMSMSRGMYDISNQLCTNPLSTPTFLPHRSSRTGGALPLSGGGRTSLLDMWTGRVWWTRTHASNTYSDAVLMRPNGHHDIILRTSASGGTTRCIDWLTGQTDRWTRSASWGKYLPVIDFSGDGSLDLIETHNYDDAVAWISGRTGATLRSQDFGSFDVLGAITVPGTNGSPVDFILAAQNSSGGGVRRFQANTGQAVWTCASTYNNQTLRGLLIRSAGAPIVVSGWRHQGKAVAFDSATGQTLWNAVPMTDADLGAVGVPDYNGDGAQDLISISGGVARLYSGLTGQQLSYTSRSATVAAAWME